MISKAIEKALNEQVNKEMFSAYLYMSMSAKAADLGLDGFAKWFMVQYHEEMFHAMKLYEYIIDQNARVVLDTIEKPQTDWPSALAMMEATLAHEQTVTASIHHIVDIALEEKDYATHTFLQWYVTEQVEEEKNAGDIINQLELAGDSGKGAGLFMIDRELGGRTVTIPLDYSLGVSAAGA